MTLSAPATRVIPRSICLAGADGAGKSTQAERLVRALGDRGIAVRVCTVWDLLDQSAPGAIPFGSKAEIDRFLGGLHADARAMFLHMAMREALDRALDARGDAVLLVVGYWLKYNATERVYGADPALLDALGDTFPPLGLPIFLELAPETALSRKGAISGYESAGKGAPGFLGFQARVRPELARLRDGMPGPAWQMLDAAAPVEEVEARIQALVEAYLAAEGVL
jgi:thymidylate kinase